MKQFRSYAEMVIRSATELIPYESPRLNAIGITAPQLGDGTPALPHQRNVRIKIDIFDQGSLVDQAQQDGVKLTELPALEYDDGRDQADAGAPEAVSETAGRDVRAETG